MTVSVRPHFGRRCARRGRRARHGGRCRGCTGPADGRPCRAGAPRAAGGYARTCGCWPHSGTADEPAAPGRRARGMAARHEHRYAGQRGDPGAHPERPVPAAAGQHLPPPAAAGGLMTPRVAHAPGSSGLRRAPGPAGSQLAGSVTPAWLAGSKPAGIGLRTDVVGSSPDGLAPGPDHPITRQAEPQAHEGQRARPSGHSN
jgi:hypothetical protein